MNSLKPNDDVRNYAAKRGVPLWKVAKRCGYEWSSSFSAYLRKTLSDEEKNKLFSIIDDLAKEGGEQV